MKKIPSRVIVDGQKCEIQVEFRVKVYYYYRFVDFVEQDIKVEDFITDKSFENFDLTNLWLWDSRLRKHVFYVLVRIICPNEQVVVFEGIVKQYIYPRLKINSANPSDYFGELVKLFYTLEDDKQFEIMDSLKPLVDIDLHVCEQMARNRLKYKYGLLLNYRFCPEEEREEYYKMKRIDWVPGSIKWLEERLEQIAVFRKKYSIGEVDFPFNKISEDQLLLLSSLLSE